jgi:CHAD domain-containing protein
MPPAADDTRVSLGVLARAWPRVANGDAAATHGARVATRRLREALPLVAGRRRARRRLRRDLRKVTRALGPVREIDVALALATSLAEAWPDAAASLDHVAGQLTGLRARRRTRLLKRVDGDVIEDLVARVGRYVSLARSGEGSRSPFDRTRLSERIARRAEAAARAAESAGALYAPEALHAVRLATKKLRYALEVARGMNVRGAARLATRVREYQDLLGCLHDLQVFAAHVARVQAKATLDDADLAAMSDLQAHLEARCRELHAAFVARSGALASLCEQIEAMFSRPHPARTS